MNKDLTDYLANRFPGIFAQIKILPCGTGWFEIIHDLCETIESHEHSLQITYDLRKLRLKGSDTRPTPLPCPVEATDVKEKWGSLHFYTSGGDDYIDGAINLAERLSEKTCDKCGAPKLHWVQRTCDICDSDDPKSVQPHEQLKMRLKAQYLESSDEKI